MALRVQAETCADESRSHTATANPGRAIGHVVIRTVGQDGTVRFYDHLAANTGGTSWAPPSGLPVLVGWTD